MPPQRGAGSKNAVVGQRRSHQADIIILHGGNNDIAIEMVVGAVRQRLR